MAHGRLLHVGRDDAHVTETRCRFCQRRDAGTVNAVIVRNQNSHFHTLKTCVSLLLAEWLALDTQNGRRKYVTLIAKERDVLTALLKMCSPPRFQLKNIGTKICLRPGRVIREL